MAIGLYLERLCLTLIAKFTFQFLSIEIYIVAPDGAA